MTHIHPHWQSGKAVHIRISQHPSSRRHAAIFGISIVLLLGILLVRNTHTLTGQLTESSPTIHITKSGLEPASITLPPQATILWKNDDAKPHILSSDTLLTTDGLLYSTAIFPEEEFRATIEEGLLGEHSYVSLTDPAISGTIRIEEQGITPPLSSPPPSPPPPPPPQNPLTAEVPSTFPQDLAPVNVYQFSPFSPTQKPFRQPETGIPLSASLVAALAVVCFLARRILRFPNARVILAKHPPHSI